MKTLTNKKLQELLNRELHLGDAEYHLQRWGEQISGMIVSKAFRGMGDAQRQNSILDALDKHLGPHWQDRVGMLLAFTPEEWELKLDGHQNGWRASHARSRR